MQLVEYDENPLSNFNAYVSKHSDIKFLTLTSPKSAMTAQTNYACGTLPTKYFPNSLTSLKVTANDREYLIIINLNGSVTVKYIGGEALPASGMPALQYTIPYV